MRVQLNDKTFVIPTSLSEFSLGQRILFQEQYGSELDEMARSIVAMPDGIEKELEIMEYQFEKMFRTFAFFAGTTTEALKESEFIDEIATIYHSSMAVLFDDEKQVEFKNIYDWNGDQWEIHPPELKYGSRMMFGEFIDAKQLIKDMMELGNGKWSYMLQLCAIYLRKKGEAYDPSFIQEGSERLKLMASLPMDIALAVGFFLSSSMNIFLNTSLSSTQAGQNLQADIAKRISIAGVGSTS